MSNKVYKRDQVVGIINSVLGKIQAPEPSSHDALSRELLELKGIIESLRDQLHAAQPADIGQTHIPSANDELDAIIEATEQATVTIMESCENVLDAMKTAPPELCQQVENHVVKIFEACTFQDITGQRIKKVTNSLKQIDSKISSVLAALEGELIDTGGQKKVPDDKVVSLLNGPALPQNAVSQDDIDKLLAEFDSGNL